jgi:hypothetical protein
VKQNKTVMDETEKSDGSPFKVKVATSFDKKCISRFFGS